jgi:hypothetical protein
MNVSQGAFRLWVVFTGLWAVFIICWWVLFGGGGTLVIDRPFDLFKIFLGWAIALLIVPGPVLVFGLALRWAFMGFRAAKPVHGTWGQRSRIRRAFARPSPKNLVSDLGEHGRTSSR